MTGLPQNYTRASRKICDVKRPARLGSSLLNFPFEPKPSFSRRVLAVAARLRRATNEAIAATLAEQAEHAVTQQQWRAESSRLVKRLAPYSPLDQLIAWAAARLGSGR